MRAELHWHYLQGCSSLPKMQSDSAKVALLQGTIEYARQQLESYRNQLEKRVVSRFDAAEAKRDLAAMAACARVMQEFERSSSATSLVQVLLPTPWTLTLPRDWVLLFNMEIVPYGWVA